MNQDHKEYSKEKWEKDNKRPNLQVNFIQSIPSHFDKIIVYLLSGVQRPNYRGLAGDNNKNKEVLPEISNTFWSREVQIRINKLQDI